MDYADKLKDPRWQKVRLEIFQRDNWACQNCGCTTETLCIHHFHYFLNTEPWEYLESSLITLCENCHNLISFINNPTYIGTPLEDRYIQAIVKYVIHKCDTCYHWQILKHCCCRAEADLEFNTKSDGSCSDWQPITGGVN
jgi:hypothetical protein